MNSWWRSPWWVAAAALVPAGLMLYGVSVPGGYYKPLITAVWGGVFVGVAWLLTGRDRIRAGRPRWPLALVPVVGIAAWVTASGDLVGRAVFAHYRPALERLAGEAPVHSTADVGPYSFQSVNIVGNCILYDVRGPGMAKASGFAWCPGAPPRTSPTAEESYEPLDGDWYVYIFRHGRYEDRHTGADPWGFQITELSSIPDV